MFNYCLDAGLMILHHRTNLIVNLTWKKLVAIYNFLLLFFHFAFRFALINDWLVPPINLSRAVYCAKPISKTNNQKQEENNKK